MSIFRLYKKEGMHEVELIVSIAVYTRNKIKREHVWTTLISLRTTYNLHSTFQSKYSNKSALLINYYGF